MSRVELEHTVGALVGAGVGAMRAGLDPAATTHVLDVVITGLQGSHHRLDIGVDGLGSREVVEHTTRGMELGVSAISLWDRLLVTRGGPLTDRQLVCRAVEAWTGRPEADATGWPAADRVLPHYLGLAGPPSGICEPLSQDPDVLVGDVAGLATAECDAVISLCRMGAADVPTEVEHQEVWLLDKDGPGINPNLEFLLRDAAVTIGRLRDEGRTVFVHCVRAESRTPAVAAAYLCERFGLAGAEAIAVTSTLVKSSGPRRSFQEAITRLWPDTSDGGPRREREGRE